MINQIRTDSQESRKSGNKVKSSLLITLLAEIEKIGKDDGNRETTKTESIKVIQKFLKNNAQYLDILNAKPDLTAENKQTLAQLQEEKTILEAYLPKMPSVEDLSADVKDLKTTLAAFSVGTVMAALKAKYPDGFDAKSVAGFVNSLK